MLDIAATSQLHTCPAYILQTLAVAIISMRRTEHYITTVMRVPVSQPFSQKILVAESALHNLGGQPSAMLRQLDLIIGEYVQSQSTNQPDTDAPFVFDFDLFPFDTSVFDSLPDGMLGA